MAENERDEVVDITQWMKDREDKHRELLSKAETMVSVGERRLEQLIKARIMLAALCKREGRVRISRREFDGIAQRSKLDVKVQDNGDLVVTFIE